MSHRNLPGLGFTDLGAVNSVPEARARLLDGTAWSGSFSWNELLVLAEFMQLYTVAAEGLIFKEHERKPYMGVLVRGELEVLKEDDKQGVQQLATLRPGQAFGEISLVDGHPRSATVVALQESDILALTQQAFDSVCSEHPSLAVKLVLKMASIMSGRLRQTSGALVELL